MPRRARQRQLGPRQEQHPFCPEGLPRMTGFYLCIYSYFYCIMMTVYGFYLFQLLGNRRGFLCELRCETHNSVS